MSRPLGHLAQRFSLLVTAATLGASAWVLTRIPVDKRVPVHFDIAGQPDRFSEAWTALLIMPGLCALLTILFVLLPRIEPRAVNLAGSQRAYDTIWVTAILLLAGCHGLLIASALDLTLDIPRLVTALVGVCFVATGNVAGKIRPNFTLGIRLPWTLASDHVWYRTHRVFGWGAVATGLVLRAAAGLGVPSIMLAITLFTSLSLLLLGTTIYSYCVWRSLGREEEA